MNATKREILMNLLDKIAVELEYKNCKVDVQDINSGGANMTAALFLVTLSAEGKEDLNLFAKVVIIAAHMRNTSPMSCPFARESYFYNTLLNKFEALQEMHTLPEEHRLTFPKIYGSHDEYLNEVVVLENLMKQGFEAQNRLQPVSLEYACKAMEVLAKFHALSLAYKKDDPEEYGAVLKKLTFDYTKVLHILEVTKSKILAGVYEVVVEEYKETIKKYLQPEDGSDTFVEFLKTFHSSKPRLLLHGDFKASNLMHRIINGKLEMIPVDFQIVRNGSPVVDLMYFFYTAADEQFRRQHYHEQLDLYYEQLKLALRRLHVDPEEAYSEETFKEELKESEMLGLMIGVITLPVILVDEEKMPSLGENTTLDDLVVPASNQYKDRFNGILNNYVEWGLL